MRHAASLAAASLLSISLAGCASTTGGARLDTVKDPVSFGQTEREYDAAFAGRPAVQRVRVPGGLFISRPQDSDVPASLLNKQVTIDIRSDVPTLADLQTLLDIQGVPMTIDWASLQEGSGKSDVGSFTAASKYQDVANSVKGGTGVQQNNGGLGGIGGGNSIGGFGGNGNFGGNGGNGNFGGNGGSGGSSSPDITVKGAAEEGSDDSSSSQTNDVEMQQRPASNGNNNGNNGNADSDRRQVPAFYDRPLPFRHFKGSVAELMRRMENSGDIAVWYDGSLVVGDVRRYAVSVMQNQDIVQSIVNELKRLGAKNVVGSVGAGQIFYSASPRTNGEMLEPYLRRLQGNLSEVTLQVALVTVNMTKNAEAGFDWSALNFGYGANVTGTKAPTPDGIVTADTALGNGVFTLNNNAFKGNLGDLFGTGKIVSVAGAIKFLSRMGDTSVAQNVELRTLSGAPVILRSGENIPYVQNVGATLSGGIGGGALGSSQTAQLGTGLTLNFDPRYDASSGIVTLDVGVKLVDLVEFVQLNAGAQLGTLTQPRTREQGINSILRLSAGQTAILGGIRRDLSSDSRTGPFGAFAVGSRNRSREVFWLFAIVRPVVTVYETADAPTVTRSVLDTRTTVNPLDDGSYGAAGRPAPVTVYPGDAQISGKTGTPTYYEQPGTLTPGNRLPSGVVTSAPPAPRNVVVPGAATQPEINANLPQGAVARDPGTPSSGPEGVSQGNKRIRDVPVTPSYVPVTGAAPATPSQPEEKPTERRSFIRPMTETEKKDN